MAIAPSSFGPMAGDLLVGNFGDGHIDVYDLPLMRIRDKYWMPASGACDSWIVGDFAGK
jgi:hypothetical protein